MTTLMTHTLPTIIGMGVVSETTKTMFGKDGKRKTTRKKTTARTTKRWRLGNWHPTKARAEADAKYFKKAGHETKIVRSYNKYFKKWGYTVHVK